MKKTIISAALALMALCCHAQFVLTPSSGVMTEDGPYIITREGTEAENYYAAKKAVEAALNNAEIGDLEYEKSFNATAAVKDHRRLPGAMRAADWSLEYTLLVECTDGKIMLSFKNFGPLEIRHKGEVYVRIYASSGRNSMMSQLGGVQYMFNSKGQIAKGFGGKKTKDWFENAANKIARDIENNLK